MTYSLPSFGGPTLTYPEEIKFNYTQGGDIDAINIRKNYLTDITIPEYKYYVRNEPFAYIHGEDDNKIMVSFYSACQTVHLSIDVTVTSGTGIGEIHEYIPNYTRYSFVWLDLEGIIPDVGKYSFTWRWEIEATPTCPGFETSTTVRNTYHTFYSVMAEPQSPISDSWTDALDIACNWASGTSTVQDAVAEITAGLYYSGFDYETDNGTTLYGTDPFEFTDFLDDLGVGTEANCLDMAHGVVTLANSIGCNLSVSQFDNLSPIPKLYLNCIDPIGDPDPTNNTFSSPLIHYDCRTGGFGWHAVAESSGSKIWDATLRYDTDAIPDNVTGSSPGCGNTTTNYGWLLPCYVDESTYASQLTDDWIKPNDGNPIDCSDPDDCSHFRHNIDFDIE